MTARRPLGLMIGLGLVGIIGLGAVLSLVWLPHDPTLISVADKLQGPNAAHWLGTDQLGRDLVTQLMVGARNSILIAVTSVTLGMAGGVVLGLIASMIGGLVGEVIMRLADFSFAFPALLFAIMLASAFGPSATNVVIAVAFINAPVFTRVSRVATNQVLHSEYALAACAAGRRFSHVAVDHVLPNIAAVIAVQATNSFASAILAEAAFSYLGLGIQPPQTSLGRMLADGQTLLFLAPRLALLPGACVFIIILGINLVGDGLRDRSDPLLAAKGRGEA